VNGELGGTTPETQEEAEEETGEEWFHVFLAAAIYL
jgi:hypothetical protein